MMVSAISSARGLVNTSPYRYSRMIGVIVGSIGGNDRELRCHVIEQLVGIGEALIVAYQDLRDNADVRSGGKLHQLGRRDGFKNVHSVGKSNSLTSSWSTFLFPLESNPRMTRWVFFGNRKKARTNSSRALSFG